MNAHDTANTEPAPTGRHRSTKRATAPKPAGQAARATMTADEYRELIQALVDKARADQSVAEQLAEEARQRFGAEIDVRTETE